MTQYTPDTIDSTELPTTTSALGVDGDGRTHFVTTPVDGLTIYVENGDGFDVFEVDEMPVADLEDWIDHVEAQRGWNRLCYTEDFGAHLAEALQRAA